MIKFTPEEIYNINHSHTFGSLSSWELQKNIESNMKLWTLLSEVDFSNQFTVDDFLDIYEKSHGMNIRMYPGNKRQAERFVNYINEFKRKQFEQEFLNKIK